LTIGRDVDRLQHRPLHEQGHAVVRANALYLPHVLQATTVCEREDALKAHQRPHFCPSQTGLVHGFPAGSSAGLLCTHSKQNMAIGSGHAPLLITLHLTSGQVDGFLALRA